MNANTKLWVQALRSSAYHQSAGRLRQARKFLWERTAFCAMGVLYDLYLKAHGQPWPDRPVVGRVPVVALAWAGVTRKLEETVITHNDRGTSFRDIASIIEAHFARLAYRQRHEEAARIANRAIQKAKDAAQDSPLATA